MIKLSRKELRRELKEFIIPVYQHLSTLVNAGSAQQVFEYDHRGNNVQVQLHPSEEGLTIYVNYWYCETLGFKITNEQLQTYSDLNPDQSAQQFVDSNEHVISIVYRGKGRGH